MLAGVTKGFCGKKTSHYANGFCDAALINVIRMLLCILIGFAFVLFNGGSTTLIMSGAMMSFAALAGVTTAIFTVTWLLSVRIGAYMLVDIALMCSVLVPISGSFVFFKEKISWLDILGLILLVGAVIMMCLYNNKTKAKLTVASVILLIVCGFSSGLSDFSQKMYIANGGTAVAAFSFYTYMFAFVILLVFYACMTFKKTKRKKSLHLRRMLPLIVVMALSMFASSYFQTLAAQSLVSTILYPSARGGALILSAVMSAICFGEKLTRASLLGLLLAFAALIVMNA